MELKCKDCKKYIKIKTQGHGLCSLPESYFPTRAENDCRYFSGAELKCGDCGRFGEDFACITADENDSADNCMGFIDIEKEKVYNAFLKWLIRGVYSREKISELCDEFEQSEEYRFFQSINKESNSGE